MRKVEQQGRGSFSCLEKGFSIFIAAKYQSLRSHGAIVGKNSAQHAAGDDECIMVLSAHISCSPLPLALAQEALQSPDLFGFGVQVNTPNMNDILRE
jgi:hypothetical protein